MKELSVNVIADLSAGTGMRASAERYMRALQWIGVNTTLIDASGTGVVPRPPGDRFEVNLVCCEVASHFSVREKLGSDLFRGRYNIGIWLWESTRFPQKWYDRFAYYDEVWAPSAFIASTLSPISPIPVVRMPLALEPEVTGSRMNGRQRLQIPEGEFLYLFVFNFHSRLQRKNPMAVLESFKQTFRADERARLIIKCANASFDRAFLLEMNRHAQGHRISIQDGQWSEQEMADLMEACDCYISLHRAEGIGLTISDAMAAGKPVIATGWSGNMDFMTVSNSYPIRYRLVQLEQKVAHYSAGDTWAEPSIEHAAEMLRYVFEHRDEGGRIGAVARSDIQSTFSIGATGDRIADRLRIIQKRALFQALKTSLETPVASVNALPHNFSSLGGYFPAQQFHYDTLKEHMRHVVHTVVPPSATLVVVSKGDGDLLKLNGNRSMHFPAGADGQYAGFHPKDSAEAIELLESARARGGDFLLFPSTAFWWLDHYPELREYLLSRYKANHRDESCLMFDLRQPDSLQ
jgi:glycosyltransferase involved in cell wall biosynthesis